MVRMLKIIAGSVLAGAALIAWVAHTPAPAARAHQAQPGARIVQSLQIPGPGIHVVNIPNAALEATPCVVAVTESGHVSASCGTREIDLSTPDER